MLICMLLKFVSGKIKDPSGVKKKNVKGRKPSAMVV